MIKDKRFIPDNEIETKALAMLLGFEAQFGKIKQPPIPIDTIIECYLDLWIDWDIIEDTEDEIILGYLDPELNKIRLNERHRDHFESYIGTESFTKAHEVGHWDLHIAKKGEAVQLPLLQLENSRPYLCRQSNMDQREFQAERYASYLLMPKQLLFDTISNLDLTDFRVLYSLKDFFGVTITALTKRLKGLKLIYITEDKRIFTSEEEAMGYSRLL
jgi:Zn-dependent peptidase ImmA (M78 family)